ncbi:hypothetical protein CRG98_033049 [Punica granatum]|uniref:Protein FAR1-RELATED SEQUENCE n=1 Tax=Punica granatum TaxID=22663 RepID=A0A2I0IRD6_PUNGR|nr:hypothetical protein CRG98_033049 [Punica granatum]
MDFESKEEAFSFYKDYAKSVGFNPIIKASRRSRISGKFIDAKFVCTRYGNKPESAEEPASTSENLTFPVKKKRGRINRSWEKTDCKASMHVKRRPDGRWIICSFIKEHNHELLPDQASYPTGHGDPDIRENDRDALQAGQAKQMYMMAKQFSGSKKPHNQVGHLTNQHECEVHLRLDEGDAQALLDHFLRMQEENPNFFYSLDLNQQHRLRNVFWVDAKSRLDYRHFGDVVFFDIVYIKNEYKLPLVSFIGVNHHFQSLLLGCALVADETKLTYTWLMKVWLKAMGGRSPQVMLTDQDIALKEAIAEVMPDSRHCFCLWHILNKVPEKVNYVIMQDENFRKKLDKCIFRSSTNEQFERRWKKIVDRFGLGANMWLLSLYEDREQWAPTYMRGIFLAGMSKAQRSDGVSSFFDKFMQRRTTLKEFLEQYGDILLEKYEDEAKSDFESWRKQPALKSPSPFGKQMAAVYTHEVFRKFQAEILGAVACHPRKESKDGRVTSFRVQDFQENRDHIVVRNEATADLSCSCHCFEFNGFLCRHVLIVLQVCGAYRIPSQYILKRWTKIAKSRYSMIQEQSVVTSRVQRYNDICWQALKLGDEGSLSKQSYDTALSALEEAIKKCSSLNDSIKYVPILQPSHESHDLAKVDHDIGSTEKEKKHSIPEEGKMNSVSSGANYCPWAWHARAVNILWSEDVRLATLLAPKLPTLRVKV